MQQANTPGLFDRVLRDACGIRKCLNNSDMSVTHGDLFAPLIRVLMDYVECREAITHPYFAPDTEVRSLDDYLDAARQYIVESKRQGAVGLKTVALDYGEPDRGEAIGSEACARPHLVDALRGRVGREGLADLRLDLRKTGVVPVHAR